MAYDVGNKLYADRVALISTAREGLLPIQTDYVLDGFNPILM
jgi:hypothetical protein